MGFLLVNSLGIYEGGGLCYLKLLSKKLDTRQTIFILDSRINTLDINLKFSRIHKLPNNPIGRLLFSVYRIRLLAFFILKSCFRNNPHILTEYYLNGLPPLVRLSSKVNHINILFQNRLIFNPNTDIYFPFFFRVKLFIMRCIIRLSINKEDSIIVQTLSMASSLKSFFNKPIKIQVDKRTWEDYSFSQNKSLLVKDKKPSSLTINKDLFVNSTTFLYPASSFPHKNHRRLFQAFRRISVLKEYTFSLIVTIDVESISTLGGDIPQIISIGNIPKQQLDEYYKLSDYLIYPSVLESLGLPLIEASSAELPIVASDLDYVYEVCHPNLTFDPYNENSIFQAIVECLNIARSSNK